MNGMIPVIITFPVILNPQRVNELCEIQTCCFLFCFQGSEWFHCFPTLHAEQTIRWKSKGQQGLRTVLREGWRLRDVIFLIRRMI
jgi:hypothetical protein